MREIEIIVDASWHHGEKVYWRARITDIENPITVTSDELEEPATEEARQSVINKAIELMQKRHKMEFIILDLTKMTDEELKIYYDEHDDQEV